jgi:hypothetical protein
VDILLTQRGSPAVLSRQCYDLHWVDGLETLVAHRIIRVERRTDYVLIHPNQYVGSARCAGRRLLIQPKYPELLFQLRRNFPLQKRDVSLEGFDPAREHKETSDFAVRFMAALSEVINNGIPFSYEKRRFEGSSLLGSLDIGQTIRLFASKGINHRAVTRRSVKVADSATIDIVWRATDVLRDFSVLSTEEEGRLDAMLTAIGPRGRELSLFEAMSHVGSVLLTFQDRPDLIDLAECCSDLFAHNRTDADIEAAIGSVSFSFTDVDALWERAVHQAIQQSVSPLGWEARLHPLRAASFRMFGDGGPDVDPDVLTYGGGGAVVMAVDAKDFTQKTAEASGVYQVTAYARALRASSGVLVYLADNEDWTEEFGDQEVRIFATGVRPTGPDVLIRLANVCRDIAGKVKESSPVKPTIAWPPADQLSFQATAEQRSRSDGPLPS